MKANMQLKYVPAVFTAIFFPEYCFAASQMFDARKLGASLRKIFDWLGISNECGKFLLWLGFCVILMSCIFIWLKSIDLFKGSNRQKLYAVLIAVLIGLPITLVLIVYPLCLVNW